MATRSSAGDLTGARDGTALFPKNPWISLYVAWMGGAGVLILFPGYFVYHWGVYYEFWPPFAGGLFGAAAIFLLGALSIPLTWKLVRARGMVLAWIILVCVVLAYSGTLALLHFVFGVGLEATPAAGLQVAETLVMMLSLFLVGVAAPWADLKFVRLVALAGCVSVLLLAWALVRDAGTGFGSPLHETASSYQGLARSLMVSFLIVLVGVRSYVLRVVATILAVFGLFGLGARSEFVGFVFGVMLVAAVFPGRWATVRLGAALVLAALVPVFLSLTGELLQGTTAARMAQLLDVSTSTSWQRRGFLTQQALRQVSQSPVFGAYGAHQAFGGTAGYAHNYLSAYVAFGAFGFLGFLSLLAAPMVASFRQLRRDPSDVAVRFSFILSACCFFLAVLSKSVFWVLPALAWGSTTAWMLRVSEFRAATSSSREGSG